MLTAIQIGTDPVLLRSRAAILESAGMRVMNAEGLPQALQRIRGVPFGLVVLCHSLTRAHRMEVIAAVRRRCPSVPILLVGDGHDAGTAERNEIDAILDPEPHRLLRSLRRLFQLPESEGAARTRRARCNEAAGQA
jgi:DNA-binding NtrC family response regulator